jgi:uncharacterized protein
VRVTGELLLDAPRAAVWEALSDPAGLGAALTGVDGIETDADGVVSARARVATALGTTPFDLRLRVDERRGPEHVTVAGAGRGGEHHVTFTVALALREAGEETAVAWEATVVVEGVLGSVGQRVLASVVAEQVEGVLAAAARPASTTGG